jgi:hypothetical protein
VSYNAAQFLGHLPGRRGARGPVRIGPGPTIAIARKLLTRAWHLLSEIQAAEASTPPRRP